MYSQLPPKTDVFGTGIRLPGRADLNQAVTGPCCHSCMQCEVVEVSSCQIRTVHAFVTSVLRGSVA